MGAPKVVVVCESLAEADLTELGLSHGLLPTAGETASEVLNRALAEDRFLFSEAVEPLIAQAEYQRGTFTDFFTARERHSCVVHIVGCSSEDSPWGTNDQLIELVHSLDYLRLPAVVHALSAPDRTTGAQAAFEDLAATIEGKATLGTLAGGHLLRPPADAADDDALLAAWMPYIDWFRAVVLGEEVPATERIYDAMADAFDANHDEQSLPAVRLGDYQGASGTLSGEVETDNSVVWRWRAQDVVLFLPPDSYGAQGLLNLLTGRGLPPRIAQALALRGRDVQAFGSQSLAVFAAAPATLQLGHLFSGPRDSFLHAFGGDASVVRNKQQLAARLPALPSDELVVVLPDRVALWSSTRKILRGPTAPDNIASFALELAEGATREFLGRTTGSE